MALNSAIEWTDATWNPVTGCVEVSPGCDHCYARAFAERFRGVEGHPYQQGFDLKLWPERLELPLHWKKPRRIFVNSMSDLFHKDVPDDFIHQVFDVMTRASQHIFQILTKRPKRLERYTAEFWPGLADYHHIWLGTSVESDDYTWRVDYLRRAPAAVRFISAEPLLGPLDTLDLTDIHWLIAGGESGVGHRPCDPAWVRSLHQHCRNTEVAFFFKQWGGRTPKSGGRELDGRTWNEYPTVPLVGTLELHSHLAE
jgi:protein gp37